jgi:hypothetical protein
VKLTAHSDKLLILADESKMYNTFCIIFSLSVIEEWGLTSMLPVCLQATVRGNLIFALILSLTSLNKIMEKTFLQQPCNTGGLKLQALTGEI